MQPVAFLLRRNFDNVDVFTCIEKRFVFEMKTLPPDAFCNCLLIPAGMCKCDRISLRCSIETSCKKNDRKKFRKICSHW